MRSVCAQQVQRNMVLSRVGVGGCLPSFFLQTVGAVISLLSRACSYFFNNIEIIWSGLVWMDWGGRGGEVQPKQTEGAQSFVLVSVADYFQLHVKECYY